MAFCFLSEYPPFSLGNEVKNSVITQEIIDNLYIPNDQNGGFYLEKDDDFIINVDQNGKLKWKYEKAGLPYSVVEDITSDIYGNVYFSDSFGNQYSLSPTGKELFVFLYNSYNQQASGDISSCLVTGKSGNLYSVIENLGLISIGKKAPQIYINNSPLPLKESPIIENGTTLVPFRAIFEFFGLSLTWDDQTRTIIG
ncbi:stalk domain-containing protein [Brevibacillus sp. SYSU BS000544]|uniref:stalk domain-containing protein n=1 Tax=Brevibacillus sp. SYSU BS000544 TaxID=3416443 RepID=UPI003CE58D1E